MLAEKFYGAYKTQPLPVRKPQIEPEQKGERRIEVKAPAENPYVLMGYQVPRLQDIDKDDDVFALEILSAVLDGYDNARINRNIVRDGKIATD
ncbi:insulinase family protein, partial [Acinetobacter baumannii]